MMEEKNIIAIEIGSSKVKGAIGSFNTGGILTVQAVEEEPLLDWVRYGAVSNVEEVATLVARVVRKIENRVSPRKVTTVYVGIGGRSFCTVPRDVERQLPDEMEITDDVLTRLEQDVRVSPYPDREMLAVVPREYVIDNSRVVRPKGTVGRKIRMSANLVTCRPQTKRNLERLFTEKLKLQVGGYQVRQLALGDLILTSDECRLGCMLVDFGAETTTVSIYKHGRLQYMATLPLGSRNITRDITKLNFLEEKAEELKCNMGNASGTQSQYPSLGSIDYTAVNNYVSHRASEIIANIKEQIKLAGFTTAELPAGIVIVGRGARLAGFNERLAAVTALPVRSGNITMPEIRFSSSVISSADASDVISVLYKAALDGAAECLTAPAVAMDAETEPEPEPEPETKTEDIEMPTEPDPRPRKKWFDKLKDAITNAMDDSDGDEDESDFKDDE